MDKILAQNFDFFYDFFNIEVLTIIIFAWFSLPLSSSRNVEKNQTW